MIVRVISILAAISNGLVPCPHEPLAISEAATPVVARVGMVTAQFAGRTCPPEPLTSLSFRRALGARVGMAPDGFGAIGWEPMPLAAVISPAELPRRAYIDPQLGAILPSDGVFIDEEDRPVRLADLLREKPAILVLAYYTCPNLCPMLQRHLTEGLNGIALEAGRDFDVIFVSFDPRDTSTRARSTKQDCVRAYKGHNPTGWHFLTGSQPAIDRLTRIAGFHYVLDPEKNCFAHSAAAIVLAPNGKICHYFLGVDFAPVDLNSSLRDAKVGRVTPSALEDQQYCYSYDPRASRYGRIVFNLLRGAGALWVAGLVAYIGTKLTREFKSRRGANGPDDPSKGVTS